jgi:hypothetical protein
MPATPRSRQPGFPAIGPRAGERGVRAATGFRFELRPGLSGADQQALLNTGSRCNCDKRRGVLPGDRPAAERRLPGTGRLNVYCGRHGSYPGCEIQSAAATHASTDNGNVTLTCCRHPGAHPPAHLQGGGSGFSRPDSLAAGGLGLQHERVVADIAPPISTVRSRPPSPSSRRAGRGPRGVRKSGAIGDPLSRRRQSGVLSNVGFE